VIVGVEACRVDVLAGRRVVLRVGVREEGAVDLHHERGARRALKRVLEDHSMPRYLQQKLSLMPRLPHELATAVVQTSAFPVSSPVRIDRTRRVKPRELGSINAS
jgi:hypothetical protein